LLVVAAVLGGVALVCALDFLTGIEYRVYPLYFLPLSLAAWHLGRRGALVAAGLCTVAWLGSNQLAGRHYSTAAVLIFDFLMQGMAFVTVGWLIADLRRALGREEHLSRTDPLTLLLNRRAFYEAGERILAVGQRHGRPVTLAYIDLDNFKSVNDALGHEGGDLTLRRAAALLQQCIRKGDVAARLGGDEFVVLLPETDSEGAGALLERLRSRLADAFDQIACPVTVSIGAVSFAASPTEIEELVGQADGAMYQAKAAGKNCVRLHAADAIR
jgi:diguanylate cyclase (GGDEF)-like protein